MISRKFRLRMKREMSSEKPTIWIGKGLTDKVAEEVSKQLDKNETVKVKILKGALKNESAESIVRKVTQETNSTLIDKRGHVFVLYRRRKRKKSL
jgi:putative YhbY family RNA-binding protein